MFREPCCGLYPDFFVKMKKRFRTQAARTPERDGNLFPDGFDKRLTLDGSMMPTKLALLVLKIRFWLERLFKN